MVRRHSVAPPGARGILVRVTGGLHHRLISHVPSGQLLASNPRTPGSFPALTFEIRCGSVLVGLRSKTSLNRYRYAEAPLQPLVGEPSVGYRAVCSAAKSR